MAINEVVKVNISRDSVRVTQKGFGIPLILGQHTRFPERIREYGSIEAVSADFETADPEYKKAQALFSQRINPEKIKIGRRAPNAKQKVKVTVPTVSDSTAYTLQINGIDFEFVSGVSASASSIVDGLIAAISAGTEPVSTTDNGDDFDIEASVAGEGFSVTSTANLSVTQTAENINIVTELQAVQSADNDWYFVHSTSKTAFDILQLAAYIETQKKLFFALTHDIAVKASIPHRLTVSLDADLVSGNTIDLTVNDIAVPQVAFSTDHNTTMGLLAQAIQDHSAISEATVTAPRVITVTGAVPGELITIADLVISGGASQAGTAIDTTQDPTDNVADRLKLKNYDRTALIYTDDTDNDIDAAWVGLNAPEDPGSLTWAFKELSGVSPDELTDTEKAAIQKKHANTYTEVAGISITQNGVVASGEYIDIIRGTDFIQARLEERLFTAIAASKKIPYTAQGQDIFRSVVKGVLQLGIDQGIFSAVPEPTVTVPEISTIPAADKKNRVLKDLTFQVVYAGAVHKIEVQGNISV